MRPQVKATHDLVGDPLPGLIATTLEASIHPQPGGRDGSGNVADNRRKGPQRHTSPVQADEAEEPVLNWVPLRAAGGIVTHRDLEPAGIAELFLQLGFPNSRAATVRAARIGQDEETLGLWKALLSFALPPVTDRLNGKAWGVKAIADAHIAAVGCDLVDAIRNGLTDCILRPVVHQDRLGSPAPRLARVLEVTDQFLFVSNPR